MAFNLENVWKFMKTYNLETVVEIENEMSCLLCKKVLVNAHSAPCGCRFCLTCISQYLCDRKIYCPGDTDDCKLELISMSENIIVDRPVNVRISKLIVKCPEILCEFQSELRKMEDHIRMCNYQSSQCPYSNIGCDKSKISSDKIADHLQSEILMHTKLLMDFVGNFHNEMNTLKTNNNELREENKLLRIEINELKLNCERRQGEIAELRRESDEKTVDIICLKDENVLIRKTVDKLILGAENNKAELANLRGNREEDSKSMKSFNQDRMGRKKFTDEFDSLKLNVEQNKFAVSDKASSMETAVQTINGEFVWKIENISDKIVGAKNGINQSFYSKAFISHSNGYKMILSLYPDGFDIGMGTHLSVYFCLMKGEFDDILEWPFRHSVTFALINQRTRLAHFSGDLDYELDIDGDAFCKPVSKCGSEFGFHQFISHRDLSANPELSLKNQIFIKFNINIGS